ncbi:DUF3152 domain-containing protein [Streptomyces iconiensis]|uniref:DUF3152 domain-containing protein n=1 Tax=Streptomyces iconiensis TaxID=1384038 RepID=A0ABT7A5U9_9ACTN|nr:DUF3152 domain-containing protein [Streptomyces iconiensis]MDJ1136666.1 DUF3152 domain-containing protein [Streptomyces iconiensis]
MGRHSRRGKADIADAEDTSGIPAGSEGASPRAMPPAPSGPPGQSRERQWPAGTPAHGVPAYGTPAHGVPRAAGPGGGPGTPPQGTPHVGGPVTPAHGSPVYGGPTPAGGVPQVTPARGGHPQQPETGGGYPAPRGGRGGRRQGPVPGQQGQGPGVPGQQGQQGQGSAPGQRQAPQPGRQPQGPAPGQRRGRGPRQEYLDAFGEDVFAAGAPGAVRAPGAGPHPAQPAHPEMPGQRQAAQGQGPRTGQGSEGAGEQRQTGVPEGPAPEVPGTGAGQGEPPGDEPLAPLAPIPPPRGKGGKGRTFTGVAAAAVTTVLAFLIAGQVTGGEKSAEGDHGLKTGQRAAADQNSRPAARPSTPEKAARGDKPLPYEEKMTKSYPLAADFKGPGGFTTVGGHANGPRGGETVRYKVDVEKDLPLEGGLFAQAVHKTLNDKRSWAHGGERSFERVSSGKADFVITLASPGTTDVWCAKSGLDTSQEKVSCDSATTERVMINAYRWARGAKTYGPGHMYAYRQMLINHEVGHRLGKGHVGCPANGAIAPVMMQQTKTLTTGNDICRTNAWPFPRG